jgi:hypothetical protein
MVEPAKEMPLLLMTGSSRIWPFSLCLAASEEQGRKPGEAEPSAQSPTAWNLAD